MVGASRWGQGRPRVAVGWWLSSHGRAARADGKEGRWHMQLGERKEKQRKKREKKGDMMGAG